MYNKPFIISKKKGETFIKYYSGEVKKYDLLEEIDEKIEQIFVVPFSQAKERGFVTPHPSPLLGGEGNKGEKEKIISIICEEKKEFSFEEFCETFDEKESVLDGELREHFSEKEYKQVIKNIVEKEINNGEGANFLVAQKVSGKIKNFDIEVGLSIFKRILETERGYYLAFIFFDGEKIFLGASPERNVSVSPLSPTLSPQGRKGVEQSIDINNSFSLGGKDAGKADRGNIVRMNPISGTFKKIGFKNYLDFRPKFIDFLQDQKEINELFMATDEELKMMSQICSSGGMIVGPILKEMANLIHTEYLLSGKSDLSKIDILRKSMWASTVIGSPIESAFRVVSKYENFSRKYYSGAICHISEKELDSAIMIRTLQLDISGNLDFYVGASLVKDSNPQNEYDELKIKLSGVLNAISRDVSLKHLKIKDNFDIKKDVSEKHLYSFLSEYYLDDEVQELVQGRNQNLSKTWFFKQDIPLSPALSPQGRKGVKKVLIIDNEDDFTNMLGHLLKMLGLEVELKRFSEIETGQTHRSAPTEKNVGVNLCVHPESYDLYLIGPGPGNPTDDSEKMQKNLEFIKYLKQNNKKYFGICLGHQLICRTENIELKKKDISTQGEQIEIDLFGKKEKVAFYNTFTAQNPSPSITLQGLPLKKEENLGVSFNKKTGEIYALKSKNFFSFQFHPESILTQNGLEILRESLEELLK